MTFDPGYSDIYDDYYGYADPDEGGADVEVDAWQSTVAIDPFETSVEAGDDGQSEVEALG